MTIYLAGSIPKGDEEEKDFDDWRVQYRAALEQCFVADFITPRAGEVDETDVVLVVGKDSASIKRSDLVIVYAEERLGAGTAMELVIAKYLKKPVVTILPRDTHHRKSSVHFDGVFVEDWIHPFIATFSDLVLENIADVASNANRIRAIVPKDITIIDEGIGRREAMLA